jgi:hypothetical protein
MQTNLYLTVFPMEALIASQLDPAAFAAYMSVGARKGSAEALIFICITEENGSFLWDVARQKCVSYADGRPKRSFYLSIYRVLEKLELASMGDMYLVTRDGRPLRLPRQDLCSGENCVPQDWDGIGLYKELCPVHPLVVSRRHPCEFGAYMTAPENRVSVPCLLFADMQVVTAHESDEHSSRIDTFFDRRMEHLKSCIEEVQLHRDKGAKIVDRSDTTRFSYALIKNGLYLCRGEQCVFWPMPTRETLKETAFDWGRSAGIF